MLSILYLMIPLALLFVTVAVAIFFLAVRSGQFDDLEGPAHRILDDDDPSATDKPPVIQAKESDPKRDRGG